MRNYIMNIGFIGLGSMGMPMATNLLKAQLPLIVWSRNGANAEKLAGAGATVVASAAQAAKVDVLFSMLADDQAVTEVFITGGVLDQMPQGSIHVNMATVSVAMAKKLTQLHAVRSVGYVAAPVLGRIDVAAAGNLNILAAGKMQDLERVQPLLDLMGQKTWRYGEEPALANVVKIAANFSIASAIETMAETSALVRAYGIEAQAFIDLLTQTLYPSPVYEGYGSMIAQERYSPAGFKLSLGLKDVRLALEAGEAQHLPLPLGSTLRDSHLEAISQGYGLLDWAALGKAAARRGNIS
jgi:3-hydroxyisobutyrate dehydrogenase-like beta-hydroxyacid dehydrogenase